MEAGRHGVSMGLVATLKGRGCICLLSRLIRWSRFLWAFYKMEISEVQSCLAVTQMLGRCSKFLGSWAGQCHSSRLRGTGGHMSVCVYISLFFICIYACMDCWSCPQRQLSCCSHCLPDSSVGEESACNAGDPGSIPGSGRSPGEEVGYPLQDSWVSLVSQLVKNPPAKRETWVRSLGWEDPLEKGKATHTSILAWRIPWVV